MDIDPNYLLAHRVMGLTLVRSGRVDEGLAALRRARVLQPNSSRAAADLGYALGLAGRIDEARMILAELNALERQRPVSPYDFAVVHAGLGNTDAALESLQKAYTQRAMGLRWLKIEPIFDAVRDQARFQELLGRVRLPD